MKPLARLTTALLCSTFATLLSQEAKAQSTGFSLNRFDPAERGSDWFTLDSLDLRGHKRPALGVTVDGAFRPLATYNQPDGSLDTELVRHQIFMHLGGSLVLWDRLRVGANIPIAVYEDGDRGTLNGATFDPPDSPSFGDIRVGGDVRVLGTYGDPFTAAVGAQVYFPTGARSSYTGDGTLRIQPRALAAGDIGAFAYAARLAVQYRPRDANFGSTELGSEFIFGGSAGVRLADKKLLIGPEIYGSTGFADPGGKQSTPLEGVLGVHYIAGDFRIGAGGGAGLTRGYGSPVARWLLSFEWAPAYEKAPPPEPPSDRDQDGILDTDDACPDVPGVKTDDPQTNGCPPDRDKDGILDRDDACPDVPGVKTDDPQTNGCPPDRDKDGIIDSEDACVDVPGVKTSDPKTNGCPPDPDRDKDGILNEVDACPDEPGKKDKDPARNGCPKAFVRAGQIRILDQVRFATGSAVIVKAKDSEEVLEAVLKVLTEHQEIKKVRVEGHTDSNGSADMNKKLSADRAAAVVRWLIGRGINAERLTSAGFGPDRPIDANTTDEGRRHNRRVEFHIEDNGAAGGANGGEPPP